MSLHLLRNPQLCRTVRFGLVVRSISAISPGSIFDSLPDASSTVASEMTWLPSSELSHLLHVIEDQTGLPLYVGIGLTSIAVRVSTTPLLIIQQRQTALLASCRPHLQYLQSLLYKDRQTPFKERWSIYRKAARLIKQRSG